ncbi:MAG TPA: gamma-glutamylcyclotransferase family protein [Candidatus Bathyarchaeia archaeon]
MFHFGYGSNLNQGFLRQYCPSARFVMKAYLPNYEVQFRFWSKRRQGGISTIIEKPGGLVHGVIYEVPEEELKVLDVLESVPQGLYRREAFLVLGEDGGWHEADLYRVARPQGPFTPSRGYVELMLSGAQEHGLDPGYIKKIEALYEGSL